MVRWIFLLATVGCGGDLVANEGFDVGCGIVACEWQVVEGRADFTASWHEGDPGLEMSGEGRTVVEQRSAPVDVDRRELTLHAAVARDPDASLRFELEWYVAGSGTGPTYWDRAPTLVAIRTVEVDASGVLAFDRTVTTPTPEVSGLVLRIVKEGPGRAIVDDLVLAEAP